MKRIMFFIVFFLVLTPSAIKAEDIPKEQYDEMVERYETLIQELQQQIIELQEYIDELTADENTADGDFEIVHLQSQSNPLEIGDVIVDIISLAIGDVNREEIKTELGFNESERVTLVGIAYYVENHSNESRYIDLSNTELRINDVPVEPLIFESSVEFDFVPAMELSEGQNFYVFNLPYEDIVSVELLIPEIFEQGSAQLSESFLFELELDY